MSGRFASLPESSSASASSSWPRGSPPRSPSRGGFQGSARGAPSARRPHSGQRRVRPGRAARRRDLRRSPDDGHARRAAGCQRALRGRTGPRRRAGGRREPWAQAAGGRSARAADREHARALPGLARARDNSDHLPLLRPEASLSDRVAGAEGVHGADPSPTTRRRRHGTGARPRPAVRRDGAALPIVEAGTVRSSSSSSA